MSIGEAADFDLVFILDTKSLASRASMRCQHFLRPFSVFSSTFFDKPWRVSNLLPRVVSLLPPPSISFDSVFSMSFGQHPCSSNSRCSHTKQLLCTKQNIDLLPIFFQTPQCPQNEIRFYYIPRPCGQPSQRGGPHCFQLRCGNGEQDRLHQVLCSMVGFVV